ncbi:hypothetical protein [Billgrantia desiderata]|uniref:hypothetical protein n=1 Tax=Billgrantia desiderata TaxID=52021 RepID=UPI00174E9010|nr:hypothetical protein [Halomonas desiderata]
MEKSRQNRQGGQSTQMDETRGESLREGARRLTERDAPDAHDPNANPSDGAGRKGGRSPDQAEVYRPDANVDDQKHSARKPGIDTRRETTPVGGAQVASDKTSHKENIDDQAERARSSRRNG